MDHNNLDKNSWMQMIDYILQVKQTVALRRETRAKTIGVSGTVWWNLDAPSCPIPTDIPANYVLKTLSKP